MASPIAGQFIYSRPGDNHLTGRLVALQSGTADAEYPVSNINNLRPEHPAKLTTTTGAFVVDLGAAREVQWSTFIHHNLDVGVNVRLQGNATNAWTAPTVDVPFVIRGDYPDGFSVNPWVSLLADLTISQRQQRWWRLAVLSANSVPITISEWCLLAVQRDFGRRNILRGSTRIINRPSIAHRTEADVQKTYDIGTTWRSVSFDLEATDLVKEQVDDWYRDARGMALPFPIVPNSNEADAWLTAFALPTREHNRTFPNSYEMTVDLEELSRGLVP